MEQYQQKIDSDILKCRQDILRAKQPDKNPPQNNTEKTLQNPAEPTPLMAAVVQANKSREKRPQSEIPHFDLANQILTVQRNQTAAKRKGPLIKTFTITPAPESLTKPVEAQIKPAYSENIFHSSISSMPHQLAVEAKIISEIVTRDINKLCAGSAAF